jgi:hypothetical protein
VASTSSLLLIAHAVDEKQASAQGALLYRERLRVLGGVVPALQLPGFTIADQADRWTYITNDTLPCSLPLSAGSQSGRCTEKRQTAE